MSEMGAEMKQTLSRVATVREKQEKPIEGSLTAEMKECKGWPRGAPAGGLPWPYLAAFINSLHSSPSTA